MNIYCSSALNQIKIGLSKTIEIIEQLDETDLAQRPSDNKHSIGELLEHIAIICKADLLISTGATQEEMEHLYSSIYYKGIDEIKAGIANNFELLENKYLDYSEAELQEKITSFWGVSYSRYEWLLEILAHVYHHRGQLHAMLVHCCHKDLKIMMFE